MSVRNIRKGNDVMNLEKDRWMQREKYNHRGKEVKLRHGHIRFSIYIFIALLLFIVCVSNKNKLHNTVNVSAEVSEKRRSCMTLIGEAGVARRGWAGSDVTPPLIGAHRLLVSG